MAAKNGSATGSAKPAKQLAEDLAALERIIDLLLNGASETGNTDKISAKTAAKTTKEIADKLAALGHPQVLDQTEQLRLALRLLECHDDSVQSGGVYEGSRQHSIRNRSHADRST